ncbi:hypothetical protein CW706_04480 [Candidatus Bathyarchaeota archaeon]|nr:MAG: hypothetical protein CW706_04480 [Candidatus Bathyarchaeota archaeon]
MSDSERMSAVDFIISVLREHEKNLDSLIDKLNSVSKNLIEATSKRKEPSQVRYETRGNVYVRCENWEEFKELSKEADVLSFNLDDELKIVALHGNVIYEYREPIVGRIEYLGCGVPVYLQAQLSPERIRKFLLRELKAPEKKIIRGEIRFSP